MPVYEYRCAGCGKKFMLLLGMTAEPDDERCPHCGGTQIARLVSRFGRARSEEARLDEIADRVERMGEPDSPSEMRRLVREMGSAMDEDMGDEMEQMLEEEGGEEGGMGDADL